MKTTFDNWIINPMVKDNAVFTHRDMYKNMYKEKFDKILLREAGKIDYTLYFDKKKDRYYAHIKIPSEVVQKFYYDVVIEFFTNDNAIRADKSLSNYNVRFYSNDPSFTFTYLRVFKKNDMFINQLSEKAPKLALKKDPKEKNPYEVISYVKSLYFAYLFMKSKNLFSKIIYTTYGQSYNEKHLVSTVRNAENVISERQEKGKKIEDEKKKTKSQPSKPNQIISSNNIPVNSRSRITTTSKVGKVSNSSNKTKFIKKTKKI